MMERRARRGSPPATGRRMRAEHKQQQPRPEALNLQRASPPGYFTVELVMVFLCLTALLVFLPLILPPLPPPPFSLLLVPIGLLAVLLALAFVPFDGRSTVGASCL